MLSRLILSRLCACLASALLLAAQPAVPDTPAGHQFAHWLAAFNQSDSALRDYFQQNSPKEAAQAGRWNGMREQSGGFDLKKIEEASAEKFTGILKERDSDRYARISFQVEPRAPYAIADISLRLVPRPAEFPALARLSEERALAALRAEIEKQAANGKFAGAVLVAKGGKPVFEAAYGLADRERKIPNRVDTRFRLGSMNKMFTAVAVAQLAQAGKIKLTDPVGKYLTDYPNAGLASKATIHHLLTHTGGAGDIFGPEFDKNRENLKELKDYVALYGKRGPNFEPGSRWEYSNYGFVLLGVLIEKVSGQSYYDYVRERVFQPAGMTATDSLPESAVVPDRSVGYTRAAGGEPRPNTDSLPFRGSSAGGGYSTVGDLLRFATALTSHKLLNAEYTALVTAGKVAAGPGQYAYGFFDVDRDGVRWFGHGGGAPGMNGELRIFPASGYALAVLANLDPPAATRIADFAAARLPAR